jgi:hydroxymethylpyrimidine pyrophosphatase-like HAD family hydrolase
MGGVPLEQVLAAPSLKFVIRHPELAPAVLFESLRALGLTGFEATLSGAPFVEVMAAGVTKATGLARLCAHLGIDRADVVAFGDAESVVRDAADEVTASNDDDGVALVIERLLG